MENKVKPIEWTEPADPNSECCYTHVHGTCPMGEFLITWKGWKEDPSHSIDQSPFSGWTCWGYDLQGTKDEAQKELERRISECLIQEEVEDDRSDAD